MKSTSLHILFNIHAFHSQINKDFVKDVAFN